jgi:hypothetical protein
VRSVGAHALRPLAEFSLAPLSPVNTTVATCDMLDGEHRVLTDQSYVTAELVMIER